MHTLDQLQALLGNEDLESAVVLLQEFIGKLGVAERRQVAREESMLTRIGREQNEWRHWMRLGMVSDSQYVDKHGALWERFTELTRAIAQKIDIFIRETRKKLLGYNPVHDPRLNWLRPEYFKPIERTLRSAGAAALIGMPGIGKTYVAAQFVQQALAAERYNYYFWLQTDSKQHLEENARQILAVIDPTSNGYPSYADNFLDWLGQHSNWLLVLDNAGDHEPVAAFLALAGRGSVLLTTTQERGFQKIAKIAVENLDAASAERLFYDCTDRPASQLSGSDRDAARAVLKKIDGMPFAIVQAGLYINRTGCTLPEFQSIFEAELNEVLDWSSGKPYGGQYKALAATLGLALDEIDRTQPAARELLLFLAFCYAGAIDFRLPAAFLCHYPGQETPITPTGLHGAFEVVKNFSLVTHNENNYNELAVHKLLQEIVRRRLSPEERARYADKVLGFLDYAFPAPDYRNWSDCRTYIAHIVEFFGLIKSNKIAPLTDPLRLLQRSIRFLSDRAAFDDADYLYRQAKNYIASTGKGHDKEQEIRMLIQISYSLELRDNRREADRIATQAARRYAANKLSDPLLLGELLSHRSMIKEITGDHAAALTYGEQARRILQQLPDKQAYVIALLHLGSAYGSTGDYKKSQETYQHAADLARAAIRPLKLHPLLARCCNNLGINALYRQDFDGAERQLKTALRMYRRICGNEHPETGLIFFNLGVCYHARKESATAIKCYQAALNSYHAVMQKSPTVRLSFMRKIEDVMAALFELRAYRHIVRTGTVILNSKREAYESLNKNTLFFYHYGLALCHCQDFMKSEAILAAFVAEHTEEKVAPYIAGALFHRVLIRLRMGELTDAHKMFQQFEAWETPNADYPIYRQMKASLQKLLGQT